MKTFVVEGAPAQIGSGTLVGLTPAQYAVRKHLLEWATEGEGGLVIGRAVAPLQFKVGERFMIEGEEPKTIVNPLTTEAMSKPARRKAAAAAAKKPTKGR
jgi:hypothetical protein